MKSIIITLFICSAVSARQVPKTDNEPLDLTPLVEAGKATYARQLSSVKPDLFAGVNSHAAFFNVNKTTNGHLFFWFFPAEGKPLETTPWIIWLQGGPGASSLFGLFQEIGPIKIKDKKAQKMDVTWGSNYSLLFIDNPAGAGFSYAHYDYVSNEDQVGEDLLTFIQQFLQVFPELRKAPLFIAGESYAGKYIPAFGHYIHNKNDSMPINLKGMAIGDGWIDPPDMMEYSKALEEIGLMSPEQAAYLKTQEDLARQYYKDGKISDYIKIAASLMDIINTQLPGIDDYNHNSGVLVPIKPGGGDDYKDFVTSQDVRAAIHVGNVTYHDVDGVRKMSSLEPEIYLSVKPWLEELLEFYPIMCYSGQEDIIVPYISSMTMFRSLNWSGKQAYLSASRDSIYSPNDDTNNPIGYLREGGNLTDVMVRGSGHMVPKDQPLAAKTIIDMFINKHA